MVTAPQQGDLDMIERVEIGLAAQQGEAQRRIVLQQRLVPGNLQHLSDGSCMLVTDDAEDLLPGLRVFAQLGILLGDGHVGLEQGHLGIADQRAEKRPLPIHLPQLLQPLRIVATP